MGLILVLKLNQFNGFGGYYRAPPSGGGGPAAYISAETFTSGAQTSSVSVTVPSGADCCVFLMSGYDDPGAFYNAPNYFRLDGTDANSIIHGLAADSGGLIAVFSGISSGTQSLSWSLSSAFGEGAPLTSAYFSGINSTNPVVSSGMTSSSSLSGLTTSSTDDITVGYGAAFAGTPSGPGAGQIAISSHLFNFVGHATSYEVNSTSFSYSGAAGIGAVVLRSL